MSVITAEHIERVGSRLVIAKGDVVTPLARDRARELNVTIEVGDVSSARPGAAIAAPAPQTPARPAAAAVVRLEKPSRPVEAPTQLGAFSGALYRRGALLPREMQPTPGEQVQSGADGRPKAAVIGAGHVGATTALRLVETSLFSKVTMVDIQPGLAEGLALDMWHSAGLRGFDTRVEGSQELSALAGADYIVMTAGRPRKPGMSRTDLTGVNAEIIRAVATGIRQFAPQAVVVVVTNPLEEMTELMTRATGFPASRVLGMAGVLDSARFCALVALTGIAKPGQVEALALGSHGPEMVIPLSLATAAGQPLEAQLPADRLAAIVERARDSGAEVVGLLKTGSAYYAPAESAAAMVRSMVSGENRIIAACVRSGGAYSLPDTRVGLPVRLGRQGVAQIIELPLRQNEREALKKAAESIANRIAELG